VGFFLFYFFVFGANAAGWNDDKSIHLSKCSKSGCKARSLGIRKVGPWIYREIWNGIRCVCGEFPCYHVCKVSVCGSGMQGDGYDT